MYETGRAFTCLLLKENVANDVINVSLFAYDKITLKRQDNIRPFWNKCIAKRQASCLTYLPRLPL